MKKDTFTPFPPGTVRGPYVCGWSNRAKGGIQHLVQTTGGWVPFIREAGEQQACRLAAECFAKKHTKKTT